jgi:hypothetical protein
VLYDSDGADVSYLLTPCSRFAWRGPTGSAHVESVDEAASAVGQCGGLYAAQSDVSDEHTRGGNSEGGGGPVGGVVGPAERASSFGRDSIEGRWQEDGDDDVDGDECLDAGDTPSGYICDCDLDPAEEESGPVLSVVLDVLGLALAAFVLVILVRWTSRLPAALRRRLAVAAPPSQAGSGSSQATAAPEGHREAPRGRGARLRGASLHLRL